MAQNCNRATTIAVVVPCYNEAITVGKVCDDFRRELPEATIYVYDNNSSDATARIAFEHGAVVRREIRQGKGFVLRQAFREIDADIFVMIDGDDTYPAEAVHTLIAPIITGEADIVTGDRLSNASYYQENKRRFHSFGNNLVRWLIRKLYGANIIDAMTGYRAMSRNFVKAYPILVTGFEIEVEMDIHTIDKFWRFKEIPVDYRDRPDGSFSKLSTFKDGFKVILTIMSLFKDYKPLILFSVVGILAILLGLGFGIPVILDYFHTGLVQRFPTAILATAFCIVGLLSIASGLILDTIVKATHKQYEIAVLNSYKHLDNDK